MSNFKTAAAGDAPDSLPEGTRMKEPPDPIQSAVARLSSCWIDARQGDCLALIPYMSSGDAVAIVSLYGPGHRAFGRRSLASVSVSVEQLRELVQQSAAMLAAIEARA